MRACIRRVGLQSGGGGGGISARGGSMLRIGAFMPTPYMPTPHMPTSEISVRLCLRLRRVLQRS